MSDLAQGWLVWGAPRSSIVRALKKARVRAFLAVGARPVRVFPQPSATVAHVSAALPKATIVTFSAGDDWGEVSAWHAGDELAKVRTSGRLTTSAHLRKAGEVVDAVGTRFGRQRMPLPKLRAEVPAALIDALGVPYGKVSSRSYDTLFAAGARRPAGSRPADDS